MTPRVQWVPPTLPEGRLLALWVIHPRRRPFSASPVSRLGVRVDLFRSRGPGTPDPFSSREVGGGPGGRRVQEEEGWKRKLVLPPPPPPQVEAPVGWRRSQVVTGTRGPGPGGHRPGGLEGRGLVDESELRRGLATGAPRGPRAEERERAPARDAAPTPGPREEPSPGERVFLRGHAAPRRGSGSRWGATVAGVGLERVDEARRRASGALRRALEPPSARGASGRARLRQGPPAAGPAAPPVRVSRAVAADAEAGSTAVHSTPGPTTPFGPPHLSVRSRFLRAGRQFSFVNQKREAGTSILRPPSG